MATQDHTVDGTEITPAPRTLPHWLYYRLFDREYFALAIDR